LTTLTLFGYSGKESVDWIEWLTGKSLQGPAVVERAFAVDEINGCIIQSS
jgi:hypothetical protein